MSNIIEPERFKDLRRKKLQQLISDDDMSEYVFTGGVFMDGLNSGVSIEDMESCYMKSQDCLEFERRVWVEVEKIGKSK